MKENAHLLTNRQCPTRDGDNYRLADGQSNTVFPKLYIEIDKMVARFKNNHTTQEQLDSQDVKGPKIKVMRYDGKLYLLSDDGFVSPKVRSISDRSMATIHAIYIALITIPPKTELDC